MAKGDFLAKERIIKIDEIFQAVKSCKKKGADKIKLTAQFCIRWGTQKRTIREYISLLVEAEKLKEVDGLLLVA